MKIDNLQIMDCKLEREERQICRWVVSRSESKDSSADHGARGKPDLQIMEREESQICRSWVVVSWSERVKTVLNELHSAWP
jgi:hypothetical protein